MSFASCVFRSGSAEWYLPVLDSGTISKMPVGGTFFASISSAFLSGVSLSTVALRILIFSASSSIILTFPRMMTHS